MLVALVVVAALLGPALTDGYPFATKLVSAAKFVAYGGLVIAVPLIVRRGADALALVDGDHRDGRGSRDSSECCS